MKSSGDKQVVGSNDSDAHQLYRIKRTRSPHTFMSATHIPSVHDNNTSCHNHTSYDTCPLLFPMHSFFHFSYLCVFLLFSLYGLPIQPL